MHSSYKQNDYAEVFRAIVIAWKPRRLVELGVLEGYSTLALLSGMLENYRANSIPAKLEAFDLFEDYQYRHARMDQVQQTAMEFGAHNRIQIENWLNLKRADAFKVHESFQDNDVDLLHVDLSNNGEIVRRIMETWDAKMVIGGIILFEGGTVERDAVEWMKTYNKPAMVPEFEGNEIITKQYILGTYLPYPGLTMLVKKRHRHEI